MADPVIAPTTPPRPAGLPPGQESLPIQVLGPDGVPHGFQEGTTAAQINAYMQSHYGQQSLPGAGAQTPAAGNVTPESTVPGYTTDEDWDNIIASTILGKNNRGVVQAIQGTPGHQYRTEYAKKQADNAALLKERQRAGAELIPSVEALRQHISSVPDQDWDKAFGPYNAQKQPAFNEVPTNYKTFSAPEMTPVQARAAYGWGPFNDVTANTRRWNQQDTADHLVEATTEAQIASMMKGNIANSDARMELFKSLLHKTMLAGDRNTALDILDHAENIARHTFALPAKPGSREAPYSIATPEQSQALAQKFPRGGVYYQTPEGLKYLPRQ